MSTEKKNGRQKKKTQLSGVERFLIFLLKAKGEQPSGEA